VREEKHGSKIRNRGGGEDRVLDFLSYRTGTQTNLVDSVLGWVLLEAGSQTCLSGGPV